MTIFRIQEFDLFICVFLLLSNYEIFDVLRLCFYRETFSVTLLKVLVYFQKSHLLFFLINTTSWNKIPVLQCLQSHSGSFLGHRAEHKRERGSANCLWCSAWPCHCIALWNLMSVLFVWSDVRRKVGEWLGKFCTAWYFFIRPKPWTWYFKQLSTFDFYFSEIQKFLANVLFSKHSKSVAFLRI